MLRPFFAWFLHPYSHYRVESLLGLSHWGTCVPLSRDRGEHLVQALVRTQPLSRAQGDRPGNSLEGIIQLLGGVLSDNALDNLLKHLRSYTFTTTDTLKGIVTLVHQSGVTSSPLILVSILCPLRVSEKNSSET